MGERIVRNDEVGGSTPPVSIFDVEYGKIKNYLYKKKYKWYILYRTNLQRILGLLEA